MTWAESKMEGERECVREKEAERERERERERGHLAPPSRLLKAGYPRGSFAMRISTRLVDVCLAGHVGSSFRSVECSAVSCVHSIWC